MGRDYQQAARDLRYAAEQCELGAAGDVHALDRVLDGLERATWALEVSERVEVRDAE